MDKGREKAVVAINLSHLKTLPTIDLNIPPELITNRLEELLLILVAHENPYFFKEINTDFIKLKCNFVTFNL